MPYQRWHPPSEYRKNLGTLALGIVIIGIIGYLLFPSFITDIIKPTVTASSLNDVNLPSTYDPNTLSSASSSSQLFPYENNPLSIGIENNAITSGFSVLFVSNSTTQELSVNAQDYAFLQKLFQSDSKGIGAITVFLVDNGQVHQYIVSKETYSIISNIASIKARASNASTYSTPTTTTLTPTAISETLIVSNPTTSGFTVSINPALLGLTINNFTLVNSSGYPVALLSATSSVDGATYVITAVLSAGHTYTLTAEYAGYTFGTAQKVAVP